MQNCSGRGFDACALASTPPAFASLPASFSSPHHWVGSLGKAWAQHDTRVLKIEQVV